MFVYGWRQCLFIRIWFTYVYVYVFDQKYVNYSTDIKTFFESHLFSIKHFSTPDSKGSHHKHTKPTP